MTDLTDFSLENLRHTHHVSEIELKAKLEREIIILQHEKNMEAQRIRAAEIKKNIERKNTMQFEGYKNG